MKCPNCGNEVHPGEAYCGQCGTPAAAPIPSTNQTEMMSTPLPRSGMLNSYLSRPSQSSFPPQTGQADMPHVSGTPGAPPIPPTPSYGPSMPPPQMGLQVNSTRPFPSNTRPVQHPTGGYGGQQSDFYQDATEAIPLPQNSPQAYAPNYPVQQRFPATPTANQYPPIGASPTQYGGPMGQYGIPSQAGPQTPPFQQRSAPQVPQRQSANTAILVVSILLAVALITIVGLGTLYIVHTHNQQTALQNAATATVSTSNSNATATANANASASATANANATATVTSQPTATVEPTTAPSPTAPSDANFTYCGQPCITNGYQTEYPNGWNQQASGDNLSIQFVNPAQTDQYATFRSPGTAANSASDVVANDLQTYYASKPGYTVSSPSSTVVIGGETWVQSIATYQGDTQQKERVEVFGTVHAGKSYIIELQASDAQFDQVNSQYFVNMTGRFQFQQ